MLFNTLTSNNLVLPTNIFIAPLAGYTNLPTRIMYRSFGTIVAYTEMVSALGLHYNYKKSAKLLQSGNQDEPLGIQLFGPDAESIEKAFLKIKDETFDIIDINCGCSVKKILKGKAGAYLLQSPDEIGRIITRIKQHTDKPVTVKIRSGWDHDSINYLDVLEASQKAGAALITFHPRTRSMLFKGSADWKMIADMKKHADIPVIGNGDIFTGPDAVRMMEETGCDGVMLARGVIENPFLIEEVTSLFKGESYSPPSLITRLEALSKHCLLLTDYFGERDGMVMFRKMIRGYIKGMPNVSHLRRHLNEITEISTFNELLDTYKNRLL